MGEGTDWKNSLLFCVGFLIFLSALFANSLVIFALTFKKKTRLPAFNILMLGHAIIGIVDCLMNMPLTMNAAFHSSWPFFDPGHLCRFHAFFMSMVPTTRIVLLAIMAFDRMVAISSPNDYPDRITRSRTWCLVIYCWIHSFCIYVSIIASSTPVSYKYYHYSCLISTAASETYIFIMATIGYLIPIVCVISFLLMILRKYYVFVSLLSASQTSNGSSGGDVPYDSRSSVRKRLKVPGSYRPMNDFEIAGYVGFLFLLWFLLQAPLFATITSDALLTRELESKNETTFNNSMSSMFYNESETTTIPITIDVNVTNATDTLEPKMNIGFFPPAFQTTVQFLNYLPSLLYPILTFSLYRSVWSRLRHIVVRSRLFRKRERTLGTEDGNASSQNADMNHSGTSVSTVTSSTSTRGKQKWRHRNRFAVGTSSPHVENSVGTESMDGRSGTPVLMATADGLLLHQIFRSKTNAPENVNEMEYVVDEHGYLGTAGEQHDEPEQPEDPMTSSCNSAKELLHTPSNKNDEFNKSWSQVMLDVPSPTSTAPPVPSSVPDPSLSPSMRNSTKHAMSPGDLGNFLSVIAFIVTLNISSKTVSTSLSNAKKSVNTTVQKILGTASPKSKYRAGNVFTVNSATSDVSKSHSLISNEQASDGNKARHSIAIAPINEESSLSNEASLSSRAVFGNSAGLLRQHPSQRYAVQTQNDRY